MADDVCGAAWPGHACALAPGHGGLMHEADCGSQSPVESVTKLAEIVFVREDLVDEVLEPVDVHALLNRVAALQGFLYVVLDELERRKLVPVLVAQIRDSLDPQKPQGAS